MTERDWDYGMEHFQKQLAAKGITKDMLDMNQFAGLTANELQDIVDHAELKKG